MTDNGIVVEDNYLEEMYFHGLRAALLDSSRNAWALNEYTVDPLYGDEPSDIPMMGQLIYVDHMIYSNLWESFGPLFAKLNSVAVIRCKANLTFPSKKIEDLGWHIDNHNIKAESEMMTAILYLNDVPEAVTKLETDQGIIEVETVANRLVKFPANTRHSGTSFTEGKYRALININYFEGCPKD
jgi:hypothetical protein